jgi:hypothetical protein
MRCRSLSVRDPSASAAASASAAVSSSRSQSVRDLSAAAAAASSVLQLRQAVKPDACGREDSANDSSSLGVRDPAATAAAPWARRRAGKPDAREDSANEWPSDLRLHEMLSAIIRCALVKFGINAGTKEAITPGTESNIKLDDHSGDVSRTGADWNEDVSQTGTGRKRDVSRSGALDQQRSHVDTTGAIVPPSGASDRVPVRRAQTLGVQVGDKHNSSSRKNSRSASRAGTRAPIGDVQLAPMVRPPSDRDDAMTIEAGAQIPRGSADESAGAARTYGMLADATLSTAAASTPQPAAKASSCQGPTAEASAAQAFLPSEDTTPPQLHQQAQPAAAAQPQPTAAALPLDTLTHELPPLWEYTRRALDEHILLLQGSRLLPARTIGTSDDAATTADAAMAADAARGEIQREGGAAARATSQPAREDLIMLIDLSEVEVTLVRLRAPIERLFEIYASASSGELASRGRRAGRHAAARTIKESEWALLLSEGGLLRTGVLSVAHAQRFFVHSRLDGLSDSGRELLGAVDSDEQADGRSDAEMVWRGNRTPHPDSFSVLIPRPRAPVPERSDHLSDARSPKPLSQTARVPNADIGMAYDELCEALVRVSVLVSANLGALMGGDATGGGHGGDAGPHDLGTPVGNSVQEGALVALQLERTLALTAALWAPEKAGSEKRRALAHVFGELNAEVECGPNAERVQAWVRLAQTLILTRHLPSASDGAVTRRLAK